MTRIIFFGSITTDLTRSSSFHKGIFMSGPEDYQVIDIKVAYLKEGDYVDLESCPYLHLHPSAKIELAEVVMVRKGSEDCIVVGYDGINSIGYELNTILKVKRKKKCLKTLKNRNEWNQIK